MQLLIYNGILINEGRKSEGYLIISEDGIIECVGEGMPSSELINSFNGNVHDLNGHWLIPGVIDSHVHFREPGLTQKADIYSESRAAVAGGVTSFMEMPNTNPATVSAEALDTKAESASKHSVANYSFYIGATNNNISVLRQIDYTKVPGIKVFMGSSTGGMLVDGGNALEDIFSIPTLIAVHCEDESIIKDNINRITALYPQGCVPVRWHPSIRSELACYTSTKKAIDYASKYNSKLHIMHLTTQQEIALIKGCGPNVTAEVCVAHLLFSDADYDTLGTRIKCNPAVKSIVHCNALRAAVRDNTICTISTDHAPHTLQEKQGDALTAPSGMPMIQFSLTSMIDLACQGVFTIEDVVDKMCHAQASLYGIEKRGFLRKGYYADMVEIDPCETTVISAPAILSKCAWSPLEGRTLRSKIKGTWVNGAKIYDDTHGINESLRRPMPLRFIR